MIFNTSEYLKHLKNLVNIDSGSYTYKGIDRVAEYYASLYEDLGLKVKRLKPENSKANCLEITNTTDDEYDFLMLGHMDTVFSEGTAKERPFKIEGEYAYGPGIADMKNGLLNIYYIVKYFIGRDSDIRFCIAQNCDEEIGTLNSKEWIMELARKSKCALIFECSRMEPYGSLVNTRKGVAEVIVSFTGKAVHAGSEPEKGASAVHELGYFMTKLLEYQDKSNGFYINFGKINGGGATNVVADKAICNIDFRYTCIEDYINILKIIDKMVEKPVIDNVKIDYEIKAARPPMNPNEKALHLSNIITEMSKSLDYEIEFINPGGCSDGSFTAGVGCPTIDCCGCIGGGEHSEQEYLYIPNIEENFNMWTEIINKLVEEL